jgi:serine protease DegS
MSSSLKQNLLALFWPSLVGVLAAALILDQWILPQEGRGLSAPNNTSFRQAVSKATPSVVNIYTAKLVGSRPDQLNDPLLRRFIDPSRQRQRVERSLGSGVIMTEEGHILTNNHVIADADAIQVLLHDGRSATAQIIGTDPATDLAVLKIDLPHLSPAEPANSDQISVGDIVLAIGNPFGFGHSVSQGIVSGLGRYGLQLSAYEDYIQTDASIHLGNSGGALINTDGRLLGINTLIYTSNGQGESSANTTGISLATPSNLATFVMSDLIQYGRVVRGWLGVSVELNVYRDKNGLPAQALVVTAIAADGPADRAGLKLGDVITSIDGIAADDGRLAMLQIARLRPGELVNIGVDREGVALTLQSIVGSRDTLG